MKKTILATVLMLILTLSKALQLLFITLTRLTPVEAVASTIGQTAEAINSS